MVEQSPIRVVVTDDSPLSCDLLVRMLQTDPGIVVVGIAHSGQSAVDLVRRLRPGLLTLDWSMPGMDAATAAERIMQETPTPILVITGYAIRDGDEARRLLRAGVLDIVEKPFLRGELGETAAQRLTRLVRQLAAVDVTSRRARPPGGNARAAGAPPKAHPRSSSSAVDTTARSEREATRQVVGVVASTGGPPALSQIISRLPGDFPGAVLVVQHIARGFVQGLADLLQASAALPVRVATDGDSVRSGQVLLAPDDRHFVVGPGGVIRLVDAAPVMSLRPCGDLLLDSLSVVYGSRAVGVVLTGMGADGARGLLAIRRVGGYTIAQDQTTSAIFGMPQEAARLGGAAEVLAVDAIGHRLVELFSA